MPDRSFPALSGESATISTCPTSNGPYGCDGRVGSGRCGVGLFVEAGGSDALDHGI
jgi:hypothetical protein